MQILRQYGDLEISVKNGLTLTACNVEKKETFFCLGCIGIILSSCMRIIASR